MAGTKRRRTDDDEEEDLHSGTQQPNSSADDEAIKAQYIEFLKSLSRNWSGTASAQLAPGVWELLASRYGDCSTAIKVRVLTSLLYLKPRQREECQDTLLALLGRGESDSEDWVRKLSRLLRPFVITGQIDVRDTDTEAAYFVIKYLDKQLDFEGQQYTKREPLEAPFMADVTQDAPQPCRYVPDNESFERNIDFNIFGEDLLRQGNLQMNRESRRHHSDSGGSKRFAAAPPSVILPPNVMRHLVESVRDADEKGLLTPLGEESATNTVPLYSTTTTGRSTDEEKGGAGGSYREAAGLMSGRSSRGGRRSSIGARRGETSSSSSVDLHGSSSSSFVSVDHLGHQRPKEAK